LYKITERSEVILLSEENVNLPVTGMTCANCALNIERNVKKLAGVKEANVNFASEQASVSFESDQVQPEDIIQKIQDAGYGVAKATAEIPVTGMTCANCAMTIERTLNKKVPGVVEASVNFAAERAHVEYIPSMTDLDEMIAAIEKAGYGAIRPDDTLEGEDAEMAARNAEIRNQTRKFLVGLLFTIPGVSRA
jgi:Cu+-exporting ATPase